MSPAAPADRRRVFMNRTYIIDRIAEDTAVILCGEEMFSVSISQLPPGSCEGCVLVRDVEKGWILSDTDTEKRRDKMAEKLAILLSKK